MPGGAPNRCPVCDAAIAVEPSQPPGEAPCPRCGVFLWFITMPDGDLWFWEEEQIARLRERILQRICANLGVTPSEPISLFDDLAALGGDSLDMAELVAELEEEFEMTIPHHDFRHVRTLRDLIDYLLRRGLL